MLKDIFAINVQLLLGLDINIKLLRRMLALSAGLLGDSERLSAGVSGDSERHY